MISLALAATLASMHGTFAYRVAVRGPAGFSVMVAAEAPLGWTAAFCTSHLCALGHVPITIASTGTSFVNVHLYPAAHPMHGTAVVRAADKTLRLKI